MRGFIFFSALICAMAVRAQMLVGVQLFDMYGTEAVSVMTKEEFNALRADLNEEKSVFNKALTAVKKEWTAQYAKAKKAGDKDFPKFPTRAFMEFRSVKTKNFATRESADKWLEKQSKRVDAEMTVMAEMIKEAQKAAKGAATQGYGSREDKKKRRHAEKTDLDAAVKEHLGEMVELQMASMLKYQRPVPRIFIMDPLAGAEKDVQKQMDKQEKALEVYRQRKAAAEAEGASGESASTTTTSAAPVPAPKAAAVPAQ
ncbi:MAG: hypothetical protein RSD41_04805 [Kiritimatiellia bacterium]